MQTKRILSGKQAICNFVGRGWSTVERWITEENFPARKIDGKWESDIFLIDNWRRRQIKKIQRAIPPEA